MSKLHSETEKRKRTIFDNVIRKKLGDSVTKEPSTYIQDHVSYSDGADPDSSQLPECNEPFMPDGAAVLRNPSLIDEFIQN